MCGRDACDVPLNLIVPQSGPELGLDIDVKWRLLDHGIWDAVCASNLLLER
jgi:hypothetical protein